MLQNTYLSLPIRSQSLSSTVIDSVLLNCLPAKSKASVYKIREIYTVQRCRCGTQVEAQDYRKANTRNHALKTLGQQNDTKTT